MFLPRPRSARFDIPRIYPMNSSQFSNDKTSSRRDALKRLAVLCGAALAPALLCSSGCQTVKDAFGSAFKKEPKKESKTIDDVLEAERPSW